MLAQTTRRRSSTACGAVSYLKGGFDLGVFALWRGGGRREKIGQKRQKQGHVLGNELAEVHVSERPVHEESLCLVGIVALCLSCRSQHLREFWGSRTTGIVMPNAKRIA